MKKILGAMTVMLMLILCSCGSDDSEAFKSGEEINKAQEIAVIPPGQTEACERINDKESINAFVTALDVDRWKMKPLHGGAQEIGSFGLSQEKTVRLGQADTDTDDMYDIGRIILYEDNYIILETAGMDMTFKVSNDTSDYLGGYFE